MKLRQKLEADPARPGPLPNDAWNRVQVRQRKLTAMAERKARLMDRLRMRTTLLIPLLLLCFGCTPISLLILQTIVKQQAQASLALDLQHSVQTYQNLARQRRELLVRESAAAGRRTPPEGADDCRQPTIADEASRSGRSAAAISSHFWIATASSLSLTTVARGSTNPR